MTLFYIMPIYIIISMCFYIHIGLKYAYRHTRTRTCPYKFQNKIQIAKIKKKVILVIAELQSKVKLVLSSTKAAFIKV